MNSIPKTGVLKECILNLECSILIQNANLNTTSTTYKTGKVKSNPELTENIPALCIRGMKVEVNTLTTHARTKLQDFSK